MANTPPDNVTRALPNQPGGGGGGGAVGPVTPGTDPDELGKQDAQSYDPGNDVGVAGMSVVADPLSLPGVDIPAVGKYTPMRLDLLSGGPIVLMVGVTPISPFRLPWTMQDVDGSGLGVGTVQLTPNGYNEVQVTRSGFDYFNANMGLVAADIATDFSGVATPQSAIGLKLTADGTFTAGEVTVHVGASLVVPAFQVAPVLTVPLATVSDVAPYYGGAAGPLLPFNAVRITVAGLVLGTASGVLISFLTR